MSAPQMPMLTLAQMLREQARIRPNKVAIRQKDYGIWKPFTWADYDRRAMHVAHGLLALGLAPRSHAAILSENRIEWVLTQLGTTMAGSVAVGVYPTSPANEVAYVLAHSDSEFVICQDQEQVDKVLEVRDQLPKVRRVIVIETKGLKSYPQDFVMSFDALEALGAVHAQEHPGEVEKLVEAQTLDEVCLMIYTSGSTGKPKGAMLTNRNLRAQAIAVGERLQVDASTTHLSYLPLCHVAEQILTTMTPIYFGSLVNFGESIRTVQEDLREVAPTIFLGVPRIWEKLNSAIYIRMLETGGYRKALYDWAYRACEPFAETPRAQRSLWQRLVFGVSYLLVFHALLNYIGLRNAKVALTGAAPISPKVVRFFRTIGVPLVEVYGATETSGMITGQTLDRMSSGAVGTLVVGAEAKIDDTGEFLVRGEQVFAGYYKNEEATAKTIRDGWLHTGDVLVFEDGEYKVVDRLKDIMITAGGKNLSPSEIENTVKASPFIKECIVIGERRKYVSALIQIDFETVGKWAEDHKIAFTNFRNLAENEEVRALVEREIAAANAQLAQVSHIRKFHLLNKELDHDDDEVTATMKVRRSNIQEKYASEIEGLYA